MKNINLVTLALCSIAIAACSKSKPAGPSKDNGTVYTTFYPTTYFAERIAGGLVPVVCPLPTDADPIYWQPPREALADFQQAAIIVLNGAGFEKWVETASLPTDRIVVAGDLADENLIRYEDAVIHRHGPGGEHTHEGVDGHTWLDTEIAKIQTGTILAAMSRRWPEHATAFESNATALIDDLAAIDLKLRFTPPPMLASHPAYNYIARRCNWDIDNLDLDPESMPTAAQLDDIRSRLTNRPVKTLLWESQPLPEIAAKLETDFGLLSVVFSPCESAPQSGDYLSVMNANIDRLANAGNPSGSNRTNGKLPGA